MSAIRTENLGKVYKGGKVGLSWLDLDVQVGEAFGFLGPNGAGKSTTIQLLLNLIRPTTGIAFVFEEQVACTQVRQRVGYLPESVNLHSYYTGRRLLEFYGSLVGIERSYRSDRAAEMLELVGLLEDADRSVSQYSKGMQQRLGLAQALINDPDLLILDEPTSNLDPVARRDFRNIVLDLKTKGKTIFISSHILSEVESVCDRFAILKKGQLRRLGTLEELSSGGTSSVVVRDLPPDALRALSSRGLHLTLRDREAAFTCNDEAEVQELQRLLGEYNVKVERIETETQSLEAIFFGTIDH